ncbi:DUF6985 domain-containing protein [Rhizobium leguminosarum]|uniref:DUF6985 domain-containing protein n=1 Tax=Rhizobium leguminosarum TaxID=384 RepID=UPI000369D676|nr:hypothetical protein [Rhizobium leguminosarum]
MATIVVPYFDDAEVELAQEADRDDAKSIAALNAFLALTSADREADSRHVFACYKDFYAETGEPEWLDEEMGASASPVEIWNSIRPGPLTLRKGWGDDDNWYVVMEAECAWDAEDGIMLVWRNGTTLSKVGPYNGHLTNKNAYGDETLRDVVYKARNTEYMTRIVELGSR